MNILEALADSAPAQSTRKCKVQRWLDDIADDTPGKADLVATIETTDPKADAYRTVEQVEKVLYHLGLSTSNKTVGDHRAKRCRCYT